MSYDPEKLRRTLLGLDDGGDESAGEAEEKDRVPSKPSQPASPEPSQPTEDPPKPDRRELPSPPDDSAEIRTPADPPAETAPEPPPQKAYEPRAEEAEKAEAPDDLEVTSADGFAPLRQVFRSSPERRPEEFTPDAHEMKVPPRPGEAKRSAPASGERDVKREAKVSKRKTPRPPPRPRGPALPPSPLSILTLIGGTVSLAGAAAALSIGIGIGNIGPATQAPLALTGIGLVLVVSFMGANRFWIRESLSTRSVRYTANVATVILSLLAIMVLANVLAYRYHYRLDLSAGRVHSLSPQSLRVLDDINRAGERVTITAFVPAREGYRSVIENLVGLYQYHSNRLDFTFVDPDIQRELTESKGIDRIPSVLFELGHQSGDRHAVVTDIDERHFTSALLSVRDTRSRLVSFLAGHGEPDPYSDDRSQPGLSKFRDRLELDNYQVNKLWIPEANGVPPETTILLIVAPERDLEPEELSAIDEYLDGGGSLMCLLEPGRPAGGAGLADLLARYGIALNPGIVLDDERNSYGDPASPILIGSPQHEITASEKEPEGLPLVFLHAGSLDYTATSRLPDVETESLVRSLGSSWSETADSFEFDEGIDTRESLQMALIATRTQVVEPHGSASPESDGSSEDSESQQVEAPGVDVQSESGAATPRLSQVLVVHDASFVQNANFDRFYNRDFALNAVNYLTSRQDLISIRPAERTRAGQRPLDLSAGQRSAVFAVSVVLTPLLIAFLGGWVWWRRR